MLVETGKGESLSIQKSKQRSGSFTIKLPYVHLHIKKIIILTDPASSNISIRRIPKTQRGVHQGVFVLLYSNIAIELLSKEMHECNNTDTEEERQLFGTKTPDGFMTPPGLW